MNVTDFEIEKAKVFLPNLFGRLAEELERIKNELKETEEMAKLNSIAWKMDSDTLKKEGNTYKEQLAESEERRRYFATHIACEHCKTVHKSGNQSCCEVIEKERNALEKQLATTRSNYLFQISEQDAEIERLNERLARMGEALTLVLKICVRTDGLDMREFSNALSSYDPKWIESVRAKAKAEGMRKVITTLNLYTVIMTDKLQPFSKEATDKFMELWKEAKHEASCLTKQNQSREKKG